MDPLDSTSRILTPQVLGDAHYNCAQRVKSTLQRFTELQDIIAILGMDELAEEDKLSVLRARKIQKFMTQSFFVAETFTGVPGQYVSRNDTVNGFKKILNGECDHIAEQHFYMTSTIEKVFERHEQEQRETKSA